MTSATRRIFMFQVRDVARSRWVYAYALFFLVCAEGLLRFTGGESRALLGLTNIVLLVVPFVSITFGSMYVYSARDFVVLMLAQPMTRAQLYLGILFGLVVPLASAVLLGLGIPLLIHGSLENGFAARALALVLTGIALTAVMTVIAVWVAFRIADRIRGLALAISLWMFLTVIYDGLLLLVVTGFSEYPLERVVLALSFFNPVDLARILLLLQFDITALMSYTGAVFSHFISGSWGLWAVAGALVFWTVLPAWMGCRAFQKRDF